MNKIWIDLTDLSVWSGHHTGTQRVVYEIAKRYYGRNDVDYFVFNPKNNTFHQYDFKQVLDKVEASQVAQETTINQEPPRPPLVKHALLRAYHNSPELVKKHFTEHRRKQIKRVYKKGRSLLKKPVPSFIWPDTPPINFSAQDTLLVMGKPWDHPSFIETVRREKPNKNYKVIQVVYDLIPVFFPHLFGLPLFKPYTKHMFETAALSDGLLAISKSSKRDMEKFCERLLIPTPPIEVIRLGDDFTKTKPKKPPITSLEKGNFILCVGTIEVRKNHQLLYAAYKLGLAEGKSLPKLVIVGGKGWYTHDILYAFDYDPQMKDLAFIGGRSDQELEWLYENCKFTIYPSVYEGWGLPIAESLARGKICVASNTSSMTEIAGELIDYFNPYDSRDCLEKITKYLEDNALRQKEKEIQSKYKLHPWGSTYKQVDKFVSKHSKGVIYE